MLFITFSLVTLASYVIQRKSQLYLLLLIFSSSTETFSSIIVIIFASLYALKGLSSLRVLAIAHGVAIATVIAFNVAALIRFKKNFKLITEKKKPDSEEGSN